MTSRRISGTGVYLTLLLVSGPVPGQSQQVVSRLDSLELRILETRVQKARLRVSEASFFRRLIPRIQATASFGLKDVIFVDPLTADPYLLGHDSFRLTISLPVTDVFDFTRHETARLELAQLEMEYQKACIVQVRRRDALMGTVARLERHLELLREELPLKARLLTYREILFQQGKSDYDTLVRARLQILSLRRSILDAEERLENARLALE
jgi:outer membrane protein TolC